MIWTILCVVGLIGCAYAWYLLLRDDYIGPLCNGNCNQGRNCSCEPDCFDGRHNWLLAAAFICLAAVLAIFTL